MAANTHSVVRSAAGTQSSSSFADIVNFSSPGDTLTIDNVSTTVNLWVTFAIGGTAATPTSGGDNCYYVPAGSFRVYNISGVSQVKLIGDANSSSYVVSSL